MNIKIITASAGTGKTTRLAKELSKAVQGQTRPEAILATTFTKQAAAELLNRARTRLLKDGRGQAAQTLLTARIGTVNAVCGSLVADFSFELGLSPELRVLDEAGAELALKRALASVVTDEVSNELQAFRGKFDFSFDWHYEVRRLIEAARANGLDAEGSLAASADRSVASLDQCLGPVTGTAEALDAALRSEIDTALEIIQRSGDATKGTQSYCDFLAECRRNLDLDRLRWGDWAKLQNEHPTKKSLDHAAPVQAAAARHLGHPRLREDLHRLIRLMFEVAVSGLREYQRLKQDQGLLDFVDQEVWALELLSRPDIREILAEQLDLVLVDEFQDTSPLQLAIFLKLAELAPQSVWVGDPKQAIFGFRGTDPALMDAAIESLSSPSRDADLVLAALDTVERQSQVETLQWSFRSRPALVELTNEVFSRAFSQQQKMPAERVRTEPVRSDAAELGPAVSHWPLSGSGRMSKDVLAQAVAAGVRDLLATRPTIWDRRTGSHPTAAAADLAILCRTNDQCLRVSESLGQLGIASVVARVGLLDAAEAQVLLAGLRLWVDPRDRLAAATLVRILDHPDDAAAFAEKVLAPESPEHLARTAAVAAVLTSRNNEPDLDVLAVVSTVVDALDLRRLCAAWGEPIQRTANLDALMSHATCYCEQRRAGGDAPSVVGFLAHLENLVQDSGWGESRSDTTARVGSDAAVTVSTWHAAKGLEWPIVVLFGLESVREPAAYGVHVLSDRTAFDVNDPLGGRWIHFWPNPYTTSNQSGPVKEAYAQSEAYRYVSRQAEREALRVLYVGWTRACDRLILAAQQGKLLGGLLGTLNAIEPEMIREPAVTAGLVESTWAAHDFKLQVTASQPAEPIEPRQEPGMIRAGRPVILHEPASLSPSSASPRPARLGKPERLGPPVRIHRSVDMDFLGTTIHNFFAADDPLGPKPDRLALAAGLLDRFQVAGALAPADLLELGNRLSRWVRKRFSPNSRLRTEWPLGLKLETGTLLLGTADLLVETEETFAIIDHKSFGWATAQTKAEALAGQLGCYADAVARALPGKTVSTWVHLPLEGLIAEVQEPPPRQLLSPESSAHHPRQLPLF
jgi:ATP-dependent exoDNAse (exonuclease V) beta subunit